MKYRYTRYTGDELEGIDLEELVSKLSDMLLSSGFDDDPRSPDPDQKMSRQDLHDAILEALLSGGLLSQETIEQLLGDPADADAASKIEQLIDDIVKKMQQQGYITGSPDFDAERERRDGQGGGDGPDGPPATFEATDKTIDFLGYRALRDLLGSLGKSSAGRHDTRDLSTGIEAEAAPKPYEFGDTMNLDASATLMRAVQRSGLRLNAAGGLDVDYDDLMVSQGEYQSSCATVLMLDCSHSMILYGEDRFTPAKRVALALAHLIKHQYPGDALHCVLFHDAAEEIPLSQLARVRVGPYYTNTRDGLRVARRILERQKKDMRQIIMITDGKPSAMTLPDGRIYRNAFGLDPHIVQETFAEVAACRKGGIMINTFMLARDHDLVSFVRRVAEICHGKAYFTTPYTLGEYVLMDYMDKKTRTVH
jgi:Ca-activated chloride channel family protein